MFNFPKSLRVLIKTPRDCTEILVELINFLCELCNDVQSRSALRHPIQMPLTRKRTRKSTGNKAASRILGLEKSLAKLAVQKSTPKPKKAKPFREVGGTIGKSVGAMFGRSSLGMGIGRWLGTGIGTIFGSGTYQQVGASPGYNVITNGSQIPQFSTSRQTNIVCHREYLGDFFGTAGFVNNPYALNPGLNSTFPWLSTIAANYQEYRFHGLVFEFRSLITDFVTGGAPGVVVMATNYNSDAVVYTTKQQMENSEYAVSTKPTINLMHGIECAVGQTILPEKFIRQGAVPAGQDLRLYDLGIFQFATQANPVQDLGELWVSYCCEFFKPILPVVEAEPGTASHSVLTGGNGTNPFGATLVRTTGGLATAQTNVALSITFAEPGEKYLINVCWSGTASAALTYPSTLFGGCVPLLYFDNATVQNFVSPPNGVTSIDANFQVVVQSTSITGPAPITIVFGQAGTLPVNSTVDVYVIQLDPAVMG